MSLEIVLIAAAAASTSIVGIITTFLRSKILKKTDDPNKISITLKDGKKFDINLDNEDDLIKATEMMEKEGFQ